MESKYALTPAMVRRHTAPPNTLIVTFANPQHGAFALNWARLLDGLGLPSLVGTAARLDVERELRAAGAGVSCFGSRGAGSMICSAFFSLCQSGGALAERAVQPDLGVEHLARRLLQLLHLLL